MNTQFRFWLIRPIDPAPTGPDPIQLLTREAEELGIDHKEPQHREVEGRQEDLVVMNCSAQESKRLTSFLTSRFPPSDAFRVKVEAWVPGRRDWVRTVGFPQTPTEDWARDFWAKLSPEEKAVQGMEASFLLELLRTLQPGGSRVTGKPGSECVIRVSNDGHVQERYVSNVTGQFVEIRHTVELEQFLDERGALARLYELDNLGLT